MSIDFIDIRKWDHQRWLDFRMQGIGGSEVGGIFGSSKWDDPMKIHLNKTSEPMTTFSGNKFTKAGQGLETWITNKYQYWDELAKDPIMKMWENEEKGKKINSVRSVFAYVVNSKYPWLFSSIDRRILRNRRNKKGRGILEAKNTVAMERNTYTYGINPSHVLQVYQYLMVLEWEFAEVILFVDGNTFDVIEFEPDKEIFESIEYITAKFWKNVEKCRAIKEEYKIPTYYGMPDFYFTSEQRDGIAILQSLEPELTSVSYQWITDLIIPTPQYTEMIGTQDIFELAVKYHKAIQDRGENQKEIDMLKAKIIAELKGVHVAKFDEGRVSYKPDVNGVSSVHISPKLMK